MADTGKTSGFKLVQKSEKENSARKVLINMNILFNSSIQQRK